MQQCILMLKQSPTKTSRSVLFSFCKHAHTMTFSSSKDRPTALPLSLVSLGIPHAQLWVFPPSASNEPRRQRPDYLHWPRSVSSGRLPQHSRTGFPLTRWKGEEGGRKTDPGSSQSALLGRLMNVQDFTIFATQASGVRLQWVTVSQLENPPTRHLPRPPPPRQPTSPTVHPRTCAGRPPSLHKHWRSILDCSCHHLPRPFNSLPWLRRFLPAARAHGSNRKLAHAASACIFITPQPCLCQVAAALMHSWASHLTVWKHTLKFII